MKIEVRGTRGAQIPRGHLCGQVFRVSRLAEPYAGRRKQLGRHLRRLTLRKESYMSNLEGRQLGRTERKRARAGHSILYLLNVKEHG